jgi:hypothetical protein
MRKFRIITREEVKDWVLKEYFIHAESEDQIYDIFDTGEFWGKVSYVGTLDREYQDETTGFAELDSVELVNEEEILEEGDATDELVR